MAKRASQEINAGSMADIAFLLLIFFLVATTMNVDSGIMRTLPPMADENQKADNIKVNKRNLMHFSINQVDGLYLNGTEDIRLDQIVEKAKEFIMNSTNSSDLPELVDVEIPLLGKVKVGKGVISLQNTRQTSYDMYVKVQNELTRAYNELREDASQKYFYNKFEDLSGEQQEAIRDLIPMRISEAEPKETENK